jgi:hypothetical protein
MPWGGIKLISCREMELNAESFNQRSGYNGRYRYLDLRHLHICIRKYQWSTTAPGGHRRRTASAPLDLMHPHGTNGPPLPAGSPSLGSELLSSLAF